MQDPLAQRVGRNIRHYRKLKGLTQQELGLAVDLDPKSLSRIEGGFRMPGLPLIERIATALDIEMWQLVDDDQQQARELEELKRICEIADLDEHERELILDLANRCVEFFRENDS